MLPAMWRIAHKEKSTVSFGILQLRFYARLFSRSHSFTVLNLRKKKMKKKIKKTLNNNENTNSRIQTHQNVHEIILLVQFSVFAWNSLISSEKQITIHNSIDSLVFIYAECVWFMHQHFPIINNLLINSHTLCSAFAFIRWNKSVAFKRNRLTVYRIWITRNQILPFFSIYHLVFDRQKHVCYTPPPLLFYNFFFLSVWVISIILFCFLTS